MTYTDYEKAFFGVCPHCQRIGGNFNVGRGHWGFCREHGVKWWVGSNLFSVEQTVEEQERVYNEIGAGDFTEVEPCTTAPA